MKNLLTITFVLIITFCQAQTTKFEIDDNTTYTEVTEPATPILPMNEYYQGIGNLVKYPKQAKEDGIVGKVFIEFVVNKKGKVTDAKVIKGIGAGCDEIALEAVKNAGDWNPGKLNGKIVKQKMVIPINFAL